MDFRANDEAKRFTGPFVGQQKQHIGMLWTFDPLCDQARFAAKTNM